MGEIELKDRCVMVTGAGGTIGEQLAQVVAERKPSWLVLLNHNELALYTIDRDIRKAHPELLVTALLTDITNEPHIARIADVVKPDIIFHAAAVKHVPLAESNPCQAVLTNIMGTRNLIQAWPGARFVQISTDKAVYPSSVMGATKRAAELLCQIHSEVHCTVVRFGNIVGSSGSVIPLFKKQIADGGPVTVTHEDVERSFMTVEAAIELVMVAPTLKANANTVFALEMGKPVRIHDLAVELIGDADVKIQLVGLRVGEKLQEDMFYSWEKPEATEHPGILFGTMREANAELILEVLRDLEKAAKKRSTNRALALLKELIPEFER